MVTGLGTPSEKAATTTHHQQRRSFLLVATGIDSAIDLERKYRDSAFVLRELKRLNDGGSGGEGTTNYRFACKCDTESMPSSRAIMMMVRVKINVIMAVVLLAV